MTGWQMILIVVISVVVTLGITWVSLPILRRFVLDIPNERSSHKVPTPTGGGVGIFAGISVGLTVAILIGMPAISIWFVAAVVLITILGFVDDISKGLPVSLRFILQITAASFVVLSNGGLERFPLPPPFDIYLFSFIGKIVAIVWIVGVTNIYNFLDGIDGYAGLQGLFASVAILLARIGGLDVVAISLVLAGACIGFLVLNWHPAKIFMGDSGSNLIGFTLGSLPFFCPVGQRGEALYFIAIILWFFLSDGAFTIFRRLFRGEKVWISHGSHLYQRLVKSGLRHDHVTLLVCIPAAILTSIVLVLKSVGGLWFTWWVMLIAVILFIIYLVFTIRLEQRAQQRNSYLFVKSED
jgi:UDP-N-acetylmuramyl pentapeptide phosphotransferase/UDP-N-acetylglucosamine-1-phosphate transferase